MRIYPLPLLSAGLLAVSLVGWSCGSKPAAQGIAPEKVAELIHQVIEADRTVYTKQVVNRLQLDEQVISASEHFKEDKTLPLPAQMLRMGAQLVADKGVFRNALISNWAINKANMPKNDFEKKGLEQIVKDSTKPYQDTITVAGKKYFAALYADKGIAPVEALRKTSPEPIFDIHRADARHFGIHDADFVEVISRRGKVMVQCRVTEEIPRGVCFLPFHWGRDHGFFKAANNLTISARDPLSRQPELKACAVRVRKVSDFPLEDN